MRYLVATLLLIFLGALGIFALQNTGPLTVRFLNWSVTAPVALLTVTVYLLGTLSGGTVVGIFRHSLHRVSAESRVS